MKSWRWMSDAEKAQWCFGAALCIYGVVAVALLVTLLGAGL